MPIDIVMKNCDNWGKIYVIENIDFPKQVYVGSTEQKYICKRKYRHRKENEWGNKSYGNLFDTDNWKCQIIEMEEGLSGEKLREREREYYDYFLSVDMTPTNQNVPWKSDEEKKAERKEYARQYYINVIHPKRLKDKKSSPPSTH